MTIIRPGVMFDRPIAENGDKTILPSSASATGRASLSEGFPEITETPLSMGGYPPHRLDMNGALYMLSAYAHWYQSGGMWEYNVTLDYTIPCMVYYNDEFWLCIDDNGPGTGAGVQAPASGSAYWRHVWQEMSFDGGLVQFASGIPSASVGADGDLAISYSTTLNANGVITRGLYEKEAGVWVPRIDLSGTLVSKVGEVVFFARNTAPAGFLDCNGASLNRSTYSLLFNAIGTVFGSNNSTTFKLPDLRGEFIRSWDNGRGVDGGRIFGSNQGDAIRNIVGRLGEMLHPNETDGPFFESHYQGNRTFPNGTFRSGRVAFDPSRVVPTANENRPRSVALLAAIRYV